MDHESGTVDDRNAKRGHAPLSLIDLALITARTGAIEDFLVNGDHQAPPLPKPPAVAPTREIRMIERFQKFRAP